MSTGSKEEAESSRTIEGLVPKQSLEIHHTIAECMITANHWVAQRIAQAFPSSALVSIHLFLPRAMLSKVRCRGGTQYRSGIGASGHTLLLMIEPPDAHALFTFHLRRPCDVHIFSFWSNPTMIVWLP